MITSEAITIGQSADPDDAFMAWGLATGVVSVPGRTIDVRFDDIQSLNELALESRLDLTALSAGAYPAVADNYRLLRAGASFGEDYGPLVVGREPVEDPGPAAVRGRRIAVPGVLTTAHLLLRIYAGDDFEAVPMPFDRIMDAVIDGSVDGGLIIHEGQLTYRRAGLHAWFEPARAWHAEHRLPVPLGVVVVRRQLGEQLATEVAEAFAASIDAARADPEAALAFAAEHGRGLDRSLLETFVNQYVDPITVDMGDAGVTALRELYRGAVAAGLIDATPPLDLL